MHETPKLPYCWTEGDCFPELVVTLEDQDLTGFTANLHLRRKDGSVLIKAMTPIDLLQGNFKYSWVVSDLIAGFNQEAEIKFIDTGGKPLTSRIFLMDVKGQIV